MLRPGRGGQTPPRPTTSGGYGTPQRHHASPYYGGAPAPAPSSAGAYGGYTPPAATGYASTPVKHTGTAYGGYAGVGGGANGSPYGGYGGGGGGGGYANTNTSYSNTNYNTPPATSKRRGKSRLGSGSSSSSTLSFLSKAWFWASIAAVFFFAMAMYYRSKVNGALKQFHVASFQDLVYEMEEMRGASDRHSKSVRSIKESLRLANEKKAKVEREKEDLQRRMDELRRLYEGPEREEEQNRIVAREEAWKRQVHVLQQATIRESRRKLGEKYGNGPHQVEFALVLPDDETESRHYFVVEMAPIDVMPHSIHLFLEQVTSGLWNNAWFYINGPHVLQAGPMADEGDIRDGEDDRTAALRPFREMGLETLAFPEYSYKFQHVPWSIGFTGRPGGPDFYINKVDNVEAHGPGGQHHHELDEFADPCFAKVIRGFDVLERITTVQTIPSGDYQFFFEYPVHIVGATILKDNVKPDIEQFNKRVTGFQPYRSEETNNSQQASDAEAVERQAEEQQAEQQQAEQNAGNNAQDGDMKQQQAQAQQTNNAVNQQGGAASNPRSSGARRKHKRKFQMQKIDNQVTP